MNARSRHERELDRIQAQLAVAVARAREMRGLSPEGYEPTGVFVPEDVRRAVERRAS